MNANTNTDEEKTMRPRDNGPVENPPSLGSFGAAREGQALWEQQENETAGAFALFREYLEMGAEATCEKVALKTSRTVDAVAKMSYRHQWPKRAAAWQHHLARLRQSSDEEAIKGQMLLRAQAALRFKEVELRAAEKLLRAGEAVVETFLEGTNEKQSLYDAARAIEIGAKVGRMSLGLASERMAADQGQGVTENKYQQDMKRLYGAEGETSPRSNVQSPESPVEVQGPKSKV